MCAPNSVNSNAVSVAKRMNPIKRNNTANACPNNVSKGVLFVPEALPASSQITVALVHKMIDPS